MTIATVLVPDIGDFKDLPIIEILVKAGDLVKIGDPLVVIESDKATMEIPSDAEGSVHEVLVATGDIVSQGSRIVAIQAGEVASTMEPPPPAKVAPTPAAVRDDGERYDLVVIGAGPGGYSAAFRAADLGKRVMLIERFPTLGGVCLNVGCIPSKALLHLAAQMEDVRHMGAVGIRFAEPEIDLESIRRWKSGIIDKLTTGLQVMARGRKVEVVRGRASFVDPNHLLISDLEAGQQDRTVAFAHCIIAAGSEAVRLPFLPDDPRIVSSTGALSFSFVPKRMLVIGGGIIGLEMATVYSAFGARIDVVEAEDRLMMGPDADLVRVWEKRNAKRFDRVMLGTRTVSAESKTDAIWVRFDGKNAPADPVPYDLVLVAVGRRPNGRTIGAEKAGIGVDELGFIPVDSQMRTNIPHIFAIGDIVGQPMLAHKAVHQAHVAAEAIAGLPSHFDAKVIPSVAYTMPEVAWVGMTEADAKAKQIKVAVGKFPWAASGRALANGCEDGLTKLIFDKDSGHVIGGEIVGPHAGDLISEVALAIEMGADAIDLGKTIHPHPTLGETVGMTAEVYKGVCTDLPPQR